MVLNFERYILVKFIIFCGSSHGICMCVFATASVSSPHTFPLSDAHITQSV
jgi:hypothetical protein